MKVSFFVIIGLFLIIKFNQTSGKFLTIWKYFISFVIQLESTNFTFVDYILPQSPVEFQMGLHAI